MEEVKMAEPKSDFPLLEKAMLESRTPGYRRVDQSRYVHLPEDDNDFRYRIMAAAVDENVDPKFRQEITEATRSELDDLGKVYGLSRGGTLPKERQYLPTLSDLVDRLTIVQQKMIFIPEKQKEYAAEIAMLMHDIDLILHRLHKRLSAREVRAIIVIMLSNRVIWENESEIRNGDSTESDSEQFKRLRFTHSINGVRNTAKNVLAEIDGGRKDYKIDCWAAELAEDFGNWDIFK